MIKGLALLIFIIAKKENFVTYPYVMSTDKFKEFLERIIKVGIPSQVDTDFLKSLGYTSSNDKTFLGALKFIGLVEDKRGGGPTELWKEMRANQGAALAKGIINGYAELYSMYDKAHQQDDEALNSFFTAKTDLASDTIRRVVSTFRVIAELADFSGSSADGGGSTSPKEVSTANVIQKTVSAPHQSAGMTINVNIQLQVPADATGQVYEQFFKAMKTHLLNPDD